MRILVQITIYTSFHKDAWFFPKWRPGTYILPQASRLYSILTVYQLHHSNVSSKLIRWCIYQFSSLMKKLSQKVCNKSLNLFPAFKKLHINDGKIRLIFYNRTKRFKFTNGIVDWTSKSWSAKGDAAMTNIINISKKRFGVEIIGWSMPWLTVCIHSSLFKTLVYFWEMLSRKYRIKWDAIFSCDISTVQSIERLNFLADNKTLWFG